LIVELRGITKDFGSTRALSEVSLELRAGEVHALAGENGAGKSTLIRILSGVYADYQGELRIAGTPTRLSGPQAAQRAGIATIFQELSLVGSMSVADNLLLGERGSPLAAVSRGREREQAERLLRRLDLDIDPDERVERLPLGVRQMIEIARAVGKSARVLILDEPTSALNEVEARRLLELVRQLKAAGTSVLYVTHRMEEIYELSDRITVLRDGKSVMTKNASDLSRAELLEAMLGREFGSAAPRSDVRTDEPLLEVRELEGISFRVGRGEIVGLTGLAGSGASELLYALYGQRNSGSVLLGGHDLAAGEPRAALDAGVALLASDRSKNLIFERSIVENLTLSSLARFSRFGFVERASERRAAERATSKLPLSTRVLDAKVKTLSGGNQQKVALLRVWLTEPRLLLCDEPTRGVDVGAKQEIYGLVRELCAAGAGVVWLSSELEELLELCDKILVLSRGRLALSLRRAEATRERILSAAMGRTEAA
jgi:ribose transport system ATP-binding protein